jgi:ribosome-binding protein aMBF1 (putative translation factor)
MDRKIAELALYTSDKTIDYARISQPEKIENLEVSTLYNLIIKNKKERLGLQKKDLFSDK